jgi:LytS/YehU family sensor histidine kinase
MFNSLNVLSELVYDDQKLAVSFIHQFSDIYRYVLDKIHS